MATKEEIYALLTERLGLIWAVVTKSTEDWRRNPKSQKEATKNVVFALKQAIGTLKTALKDKTLSDVKAQTRLADTIEALDSMLYHTLPGSFANAIEMREAFKQALSRILAQILRETSAKTATAKLLDKVAA